MYLDRDSISPLNNIYRARVIARGFDLRGHSVSIEHEMYLLPAERRLRTRLVRVCVSNLKACACGRDQPQSNVFTLCCYNMLTCDRKKNSLMSHHAMFAAMKMTFAAIAMWTSMIMVCQSDH